MKSASCLVLALFLGACAGGGRGVPPAPPAPGPSEGCKAPLAPGALTLETTVDGATRSYLLVIPAARSASTSTSPEPLALVFGFHGQSWTADAFRAGGGGPESISGGQAVFVYPNGQPRVGGRGWDLDLDGSDIAFFDIMLREVLSKTCVDTTRIFAFGRSYGAYFVNTLGCARGQLLRGVAAMMGGGPPEAAGCDAVAAWLFHAADDPTVNVSQGRASRDHYLEVDACPAEEQAPIEPGSCVHYTGCHPGLEVQYCEEPTGGHNPPPYAASSIWSFFKRSGL